MSFVLSWLTYVQKLNVFNAFKPVILNTRWQGCPECYRWQGLSAERHTARVHCLTCCCCLWPYTHTCGAPNIVSATVSSRCRTSSCALRIWWGLFNKIVSHLPLWQLSYRTNGPRISSLQLSSLPFHWGGLGSPVFSLLCFDAFFCNYFSLESVCLFATWKPFLK